MGEDEVEDVILDDEMKHHWMMVFEDIDGGVDDDKAIIHYHRWDVYMKKKRLLLKIGYYV